MTHQAEDNKVHLAYYRSDINMSFVWNGTEDNLVDVCWGGYGERVIAKVVLTVDIKNCPLEKAFELFKNTCDVFVETFKVIENVSS